MPFVANRVFGWEPVEITAEWGMRDLKPGYAYSLCNTLRCSKCGVMFLDMRFNDREMGALYRNYRDAEYTETRARFEPGYGSRNEILVAGSTYIPAVEDFLSAFVKPPLRMLDWGGDTGLNTPFLGRSVIHHVFDISNKQAVAGAEVVERDVVTATEYDLVVCSNVLEHVPYPKDTVREIASVMSERTLFYVEVPHEDLVRLNPGAHDLQKLKRHWHEHINFFTPRSLELLVEACGLHVLGRMTLDISAGGKDAQVLALACRLA
jgi:hypothetical protein